MEHTSYILYQLAHQVVPFVATHWLTILGLVITFIAGRLPIWYRLPLAVGLWVLRIIAPYINKAVFQQKTTDTPLSCLGSGKEDDK